jgi:type IV fimbrial biogenesis protein FimT
VLSSLHSMSKFKGFSLVELMVAIAMIGILLAFGIPSYRTWIQNTQIRTGAESILNGIQRARSEALTRNTPVTFTLGANTAWTVQCVTAAKCADLVPPVAPAAGQIDARQNGEGTSADISVNAVGGNFVTFNNLGIRTAGLTQVTVDNTAMAAADSRELNVTVGPSGVVRMCDPNATSTDPRKC